MSVVNPGSIHNAVAQIQYPTPPSCKSRNGVLSKRKASFHSHPLYPSYSPWGLLALGMSANMAVPLAASTFLVLVFLKSVCGLDLQVR